MIRIETRWTVPDDLAALGMKDAATKRGRTLVIDGKPEAVIAISLGPALPPVACAVVSGTARKMPLALNRFARECMAFLHAQGFRVLLALADRDIPRASAWLHHLGFVPVAETDRGTLYRWTAVASSRQCRQPARSLAA